MFYPDHEGRIVSKFSDALSRAKSPNHRPMLVDEVLAGLSDEDAADARQALMDTTISMYAINKAFAAMGIAVSEGAIRNWRRRYVHVQ